MTPWVSIAQLGLLRFCDLPSAPAVAILLSSEPLLSITTVEGRGMGDSHLATATHGFPPKCLTTLVQL